MKRQASLLNLGTRFLQPHLCIILTLMSYIFQGRKIFVKIVFLEASFQPSCPSFGWVVWVGRSVCPNFLKSQSPCFFSFEILLHTKEFGRRRRRLLTWETSVSGHISPPTVIRPHVSALSSKSHSAIEDVLMESKLLSLYYVHAAINTLSRSHTYILIRTFRPSRQGCGSGLILTGSGSNLSGQTGS